MTDILDDPRLLDKMMQSDCVAWAVRSKVRLLGGIPFTLEGCEYMGDIMRDPARHIAVIKGAQARITTAFMLREIHALIYRYYPQGSIYYFPDKVAVEGFSKTRFSPLVRDNPCIKKHLKRTDSVSIKQVGKAMISLLGCKATANIQGKKDSNSVRSTPADSVVRDERDLFDDEMVEMTEDRLLGSDLQRVVDLGTPTIPDFGIDRIFGESDQKHWMVKCESCNEYTCISDEFPNSIRYKRETTHTKFQPYYGCIKCGKEIHVINGEFIAKFPEKYDTDYPMEGVSGYRISHFITPKCNLNLVMAKWEKAQLDKSMMGLFNNKYLGQAYIPIEDRLIQQDIFSCCGYDNMRTQSSTPTAMAADIMKTNRVVIAEKKGDGSAKIIYMARVSGFDALFDLVQRFNVKSAVVCLRPYEESFRTFQAKCKDYDPEMKVFGSQYDTGKQKTLTKTDEASGIYTLARTEIMDKSQAWIRSGKLEIPRMCEEVKVFAKECCNTAKTLEVNTDTGDRIFRYRPVGDKQEHYRHTVNYLILALLNVQSYQMVGSGSMGNDREEEYNPMRFGL
jgi:hypothetical protein